MSYRVNQPIPADEREARLPKWAQDQMNSLRRRIQDAEEALEHDRLASKPEDSDMLLRPHDETPLGLGSGHDAHVRAVIDHDRPHDQYVDVRVVRGRGSDDYVELMGGSTLALEMQSSNVVKVRVQRR